jgi:hypothetical protein
MDRKLLPYEHQLIDALDITKDEYLQFVAIQQEYADNKAGTILDVRNTGIDPFTVGIVLTVVGAIFSVGAALLAPKPNIPSAPKDQRRSREQRFAPTFGFNSTQELASYGDPVNLVYTNQNPYADVRVSGSLVWSAIENFGSTQFMQLLLVLGASQIQEIDYTRTAFGQTSMSDLSSQSVFIFGKSAGAEGVPKFSELISGFGSKEFFPARLKPSTETRPACLVAFNNGREKGFSQAYTPSTATSLGVFDVIPINVEVRSRDTEGKREESNISIEMPSEKFDNRKWTSNQGNFQENDKIQLFFEKAGEGGGDKQPQKAGEDMRRQMLETLDFGATYMLGTAKFKLITLSSATSIDQGVVTADFKCIKSGRTPSTDYGRKEPRTENRELRQQFEQAQAILSDPHKEEGETLTATKLKANVTYRIASLGQKNSQTDFTLIGALENKVDTFFTATGPGTGTGTAAFGVRKDPIVIKNDSAPVVSLAFKGQQTVEWEQTFNAEIELENEEIETVSYVVGDDSYKFSKAGSIAYTETLKDEFNDDKPVIKVRSIRRALRQQRKALRALKDAIYEGVYDGLDFTVVKADNAFIQRDRSNRIYYGADPDAKILEKQATFGVSKEDLVAFVNRGAKVNFVGYGKDIVDGPTSLGTMKPGQILFFTFLYIDRNGVFNYFNFNGLNFNPNGDDYDVFPNDEKLKDLRDKLASTKSSYSTNEENRSNLEKSNTTLKSSALQDAAAKRNVLNADTFIFLGEYDDKLKRLGDRETTRQARIDNRVKRNLEVMHDLAAKIIDRDIDYTEAVQDALPSGEFVDDPVGVKAVRQAMKAVIRDKEQALDNINDILSDWDEYAQSFDNTFFAKCLVKAEIASYDTLSACNAVKFSFKSRLFRRISGRQKKYGERKVKEYNLSDNGIKSRMVFFRMYYQEVGSKTASNLVSYVFALRRGSNADFYSQLTFYSQAAKKWQFTFEPVYDISAEYRARPFTKFAYIENTEQLRTLEIDGGKIVVSWHGRRVDFDKLRGYYPDETERGPIYTNEWDMFSVNSDTQIQFSSESGPEVALTAVTEQQLDSGMDKKYQNMTMMALGLFSGRGVQDLRSISALVTKGKLCRTVENPSDAPTKSSSYAPDIFIDTVLDKTNGVGHYLDVTSIDDQGLKLAKRFCKENNFPREAAGNPAFRLYMDGVIADLSSWREFWAEAAAFSLLELARKNGKDTLVPAVPVNSSGQAAESNGLPIAFNVSALFTAGNILEGSYKEEFLNYGAATEELIVSIIYRQYEASDVFSSKKSVQVCRKNVIKDNVPAVRETFDASQFVTQREQAIAFGKLLCNQRRHIRQGIEFKTFPSEALIEPGDFIYVDIGLRHWDKYSSGIVLDGGVLNAPLLDSLSAGTYSFLLYDNATGNVSAKSASVSVDGATGVRTASGLSGNTGQMFVMGQEKPKKRVYRVMEIEIDEEGEVAIKAIEYPVIENIPNDDSLRAKVADFRASKFDVS